MMNKQRRRRGMTLAEIMICMAVVAISVVMVVSFSVTMGNRMSRSKAQLQARKELEAIESLTDAWLNAVLDKKNTQSVTFVLSEGEKIADETITVLLGDAPAEGELDLREELTLNWQHNYLIGKLPGADDAENPVPPITFRTEYVTDVQFYVKPGVKTILVEEQKKDNEGNLYWDQYGAPIMIEVPKSVLDPDGDMLFYCKVTYEIPMANSKQYVELNHVFCINPHMGDKV